LRKAYSVLIGLEKLPQQAVKLLSVNPPHGTFCATHQPDTLCLHDREKED
jgi:hypothetical protein